MRIGVFDSGIGGITVLTELRKRFPASDFFYLGDTAHVPYGTKSSAQIERLSVGCALTLRERNVDALVVACNTASSLALDAVRGVMGSTPVFGVVRPGVTAALGALSQLNDGGISSPILVLATRATVQSQAYGKLLREMLSADAARGRLPLPIIEVACPLLAPMIEEGWVNHPILHRTIEEYVEDAIKGQEPGVALLGCTHYPWAQAAFERALPGWKVINSAQAVAELLVRDGFGGKHAAESSGGPGKVEWIFTDPAAVPAFARELIAKGDAKR